MLEMPSRRVLIGAAAVVFFAACSGNQANLSPGQTSPVIPSAHQAGSLRYIHGAAIEGPYAVPLVPRQWPLVHRWPKKGQVLFVGDPQNNQILLYNPKKANPSPEGSITSGIDYVFGLAMDKSGTLYAANLLGGNNNYGSITIFPKGATTPSLTITDGVAGPYGIAVDSQGNVFASNLDANTVVAYHAGQTTPYETISFSAYGQALGMDTDAADNLWVACDTSTVFEIPAGSTTPQNAGLSGINGPIMITFGKKDTMFVSNFGGSNVQVYNYGSTTPAYTITNGIETNGPTLNGVTKSDYFFQSNQNGNVSGYKKGATSPFSTITGIPDPRGIASTPLVKK
jgi:hypothetical protein